MPPLQQISFLLFALLLAAWSGYEMWRMQRGLRWKRMLLWAGLVLGVSAVFVLMLQPRANVSSLAEVEAAIGSGRPVLLEVYSEY